jgi:hypothetical protein
MADHEQEAVIIRIRLSDDELGDGAERMAAYEVEDRLIDTIPPSLGEVDGHEFGGGFATIFVYGPSADAMAALILPTVSAANVRAGSSVTKRYGPPGSTEHVLEWPLHSS